MGLRSNAAAAAAFLFSLTPLVSAQAGYFATENPGNVEPPAAPWQSTVGGVTLPGEAGAKVWFGKRNWHIPTNEKSFSLVLRGAAAFQYGLSSVKGYTIGTPPKQTAAAATSIVDTAAPPSRRFSITYTPQPDWEVIELVRTAGFQGGGDVTVSVSSHCTRIVDDPTGSVTLEDAAIGIAGEDTHVVPTVAIFPRTATFDPGGAHELIAPPHTGNWAPMPVFVDPDGNPRPNGGMLWSSDGPGLAPQEDYRLTFSTIGQTDSVYDYYAFDQNAGQWMAFELINDGIYSLGQAYCDPAAMNSTGTAASIGAYGSGNAGEPMQLEAYDLPIHQFGYFLTSQVQGFVPNPAGSQGNLCLGGTIARFARPGEVQNSGASGSFQLAVDTLDMPTTPPTPIVPGDTWNFQAWYRDQNPTSTSNFTNARSVSFP
ncbi:MAG: hypothetical protein GY711_20515 [bacterium]|nr:hypothetical protein [bacterium]